MSGLKGYYSLIQYCPDLSRAEAANVGVLLFAPEAQFVAARTTTNNDRIRRFFGQGSFDPQRLSAAKQAIEERLKVEHDQFQTLEDLQRFIATRGGALLITKPRPVKLREPHEDLERLFAQLVGRREVSARRPPPVPLLHQAFRSPELAPRMTFGLRVTIPIVGRPLAIPYAYRNSAIQLVRPQHFAPAKAKDVGMRLALEGDLLHKHPEDNLERRLIVVPVFEQLNETSELRHVLDDLFHTYAVRVVWPEQVEDFTKEVAATAQ